MRLCRRPRFDTLQNEVRKRGRSWGRWVYLALVGGLLRFSFNAQSNQTYGIQFRSFRTGEAWSTLTNFAAQPFDTVITFSEPLTSSNRCYRVRTP